jgi:hypothetical protein
LNPPCGNIFKASLHISPHGGTVDITTTPGLIPERFKPELENMLGKVFERVGIVIEQWPGWKELADIQACDPEKEECPGKEKSENPFLRVVR